MHAVCLSCLAASLVGLLSCLLSLSAPCWSGFCFVFPCVWKLCPVLLCCFCFLFVLFIRASSFKLVGVLSIIVFLICISTGTPFVCYGSSYVDMVLLDGVLMFITGLLLLYLVPAYHGATLVLCC